MDLKEFLQRHALRPARRTWRRIRRLPAQMRDKRRTPREVFTEIYAKNVWGRRQAPLDAAFPFYSGPGSAEFLARPYADKINQFMAEHGVRTVVDLGCGDFRVGSRIARPGLRYIGVDVVAPLIEANQKRFGNAEVEFRCLDIVTDELPGGDLCLVREVFQHLSNQQIAAVLSKLTAYRRVIVTESLPGPPGTFDPNLDKPHGHEARTLWQSGVVLSAPPFSVPHVTLLFEVQPEPARRKGERISSYLIAN